MALLYSLGPASLALLATCVTALGACGTAPSHASSLVNAAGGPGQGGRAGQSGGAGLGDAAEGPGAAGGDLGDDDGGAAGDAVLGKPTTPLAIFANTLDVNASCGASSPSTTLLIQNGGGSPLSISSANADSGYTVSGLLPLSIAPGAAAALLIAPPAPKPSAQVGDESSGNLSFVSNEPGTPTRSVALHTTLFGAHLEFTDHTGVALGSALTLTYLNDSACPDTVKYRVHNTGNVAFTLLGPTFPAHLAGTTTGSAGQSIAPDDYVELAVSGNSTPGGVCQASGLLMFTTTGDYCGAVPTLNVVWPSSPGPSCSCAVAE